MNWPLIQSRTWSLLPAAAWPTYCTTKVAGSVTCTANSPKMRGETMRPVIGSSRSARVPPNFTPRTGAVFTKKTSAMKRLPPVNLSTMLPRNGMFDDCIV